MATFIALTQSSGLTKTTANKRFGNIGADGTLFPKLQQALFIIFRWVRASTDKTKVKRYIWNTKFSFNGNYQSTY